MPNYSALTPMLGRVSRQSAERAFASQIVPALIDIWLDDYGSRGSTKQIVETKVEKYSYLFDIGREGLVAAWGVSEGRHDGARDKARMAGHPLSAGPGYHRGHALPHTFGGGTDINLVPQLGRINIGPFRSLEIEAVDTPGAFYFTYWMYDPGEGQTPIAVDQGLLVPGLPPRIITHVNK